MNSMQNDNMFILFYSVIQLPEKQNKTHMYEDFFYLNAPKQKQNHTI